MAVAQTGSAIIYESSSTSPSTSVSIPADAELVILVVSGFGGADANDLTTFALGSTHFVEVVTTESQSTNGQVWLLRMVNPPTGTQTFSGTLVSLLEGFTYVLIPLKGVNTTTPIKASDSKTTSNVDITGMTYASGDMMCGVVYAYAASPTVTDSSQTSIRSAVYNSAGCGVAIKSDTGDFYYSNASYSTCAACVIAASAAAATSLIVTPSVRGIAGLIVR